MGFRYQKRIGGNKGWGWNVSKSGISSSYRGKHGTFGSKGFSIKTSIPGLTYRHYYSRKKDNGVGCMVGLFIGTFIFMILLVYNFALFTIWSFKMVVKIFKKIKERKEDTSNTDTLQDISSNTDVEDVN